MFKIPSISFSPSALIPSIITNNRVVNGISSCTKKVFSAGGYLRPKYLLGTYSLHEASSIGNIGSIRASLAREEDINALDHSGKSPLHHAILAGKLNTINFLLDDEFGLLYLAGMKKIGDMDESLTARRATVLLV